MEWVFPLNNGGEIKGLSDTGIETFKGDPLRYLAREICQNSLDAGIEGKTVRVEFVPFFVKRIEFPGIGSLSDAFELARDFWAMQQIKRPTKFFDQAIFELQKESIPFLRVSDFNTTGLSGSDGEFNTPWLNLTKSSGVSDKAGTAGGSFGIGKYAPYACSAFQTVFYGTIDDEGKEAFQGVSRITSFQLRNSRDITTNVGYWGDEGNKPAKKYTLLDQEFKRKLNEPGTDIFITGFRFLDQPEWEKVILGSILDGFLYAIYDKKLSVRINDIEVDNNTLPYILDSDEVFSREKAANYYKVLTSEDTQWSTEENFNNLGKIRLGLIIHPDMHKRVAMVRKTGMKIMDRGNISGIIPFAGVMLIEGDGINEYLRNLENPSHTAWEPRRMEPTSKIGQAERYIREIRQFIIDKLNELKMKDPVEEIDADVGKFLPDEYSNDASDKRSDVENISDETKDITKLENSSGRKFGSKSENSGTGDMLDDEGALEEANVAGAGHKDGKSRAGGQGAGVGEGGGKGTNIALEKRSLKAVNLAKVRSICLSREEGRYHLSITPSVSSLDGQVELFVSAETDRYKAPIVGIQVMNRPDARFEDNRVVGLQFVKGETIRMQIFLDYYDYVALEVQAHGNT